MFVQTFSQIVTGKKDVWLLYRSLFAKTWNDINAKVWPTGQRFFLQCQSQHGLKTLYTVMAALRGNKLFWSGTMNKLLNVLWTIKCQFNLFSYQDDQFLPVCNFIFTPQFYFIFCFWDKLPHVNLWFSKFKKKSMLLLWNIIIYLFTS